MLMTPYFPSIAFLLFYTENKIDRRLPSTELLSNGYPPQGNPDRIKVKMMTENTRPQPFVQAADRPTIPIRHLLPGDLQVAEEPTLFKTTLGSCVAVCLFSPKGHKSAMCHSMLPTCANDRAPCFRFVDCSIHYMVQSLVKNQAITLKDISAQLFGGAEIFKGSMPDFADFKIGHQNIMIAIEILESYGIPIIKKRVGGQKAYKVFFNSETGQSMLDMV